MEQDTISTQDSELTTCIFEVKNAFKKTGIKMFKDTCLSQLAAQTLQKLGPGDSRTAPRLLSEHTRKVHNKTN